VVQRVLRDHTPPELMRAVSSRVLLTIATPWCVPLQVGAVFLLETFALLLNDAGWYEHPPL
jgi:uncharacterized protein (DUF2062 family)